MLCKDNKVSEYIFSQMPYDSKNPLNDVRF